MKHQSRFMKILRWLCMGMLMAPVASFATVVSFYNDSTYVDTTREGPNLQADIEMLGHTTLPFTGTTAGDFSAAAAASSVIVFPEMERDNLNDDLDAAARAVLTAFVSGGGTIIQANAFPANANLADALFGYSLTQLGNIGATSLNAADAAGTAFAGGPATLPGSDAVEGIDTATLPGGARNLYSDSGETSVFMTDFGSGHYIYLGFDWFEEPTPAEWKDVLDRALQVGITRVPEPTSLALLGLGLLGIGFVRRKKLR